MAQHEGTSRPRVLVVPGPRLYGELFTPEADAALRTLADVTLNPRDENWTAATLAAALQGVDAVITGWGTPSFDDEVLAACDLSWPRSPSMRRHAARA
ncbi:MAG TPA: hypothetical protein VFU72_13220 [Nitrolancea sp.]|jgi:hypothetical protein|nr:hypothetical protein [Nitrolancea sp.]